MLFKINREHFQTVNEHFLNLFYCMGTTKGQASMCKQINSFVIHSIVSIIAKHSILIFYSVSVAEQPLVPNPFDIEFKHISFQLDKIHNHVNIYMLQNFKGLD